MEFQKSVFDLNFFLKLSKWIIFTGKNTKHNLASSQDAQKRSRTEICILLRVPGTHLYGQREIKTENFPYPVREIIIQVGCWSVKQTISASGVQLPPPLPDIWLPLGSNEGLKPSNLSNVSQPSVPIVFTSIVVSNATHYRRVLQYLMIAHCP